MEESEIPFYTTSSKLSFFSPEKEKRGGVVGETERERKKIKNSPHYLFHPLFSSVCVSCVSCVSYASCPSSSFSSWLPGQSPNPVRNGGTVKWDQHSSSRLLLYFYTNHTDIYFHTNHSDIYFYTNHRHLLLYRNPNVSLLCSPCITPSFH